MLFTRENSQTEIWKSLVHELHRGALDSKHPFRYINLATMGKGYPEIRTVILRKVDEDLNFFVFTDSRSAKVTEIKANSSVSLHFYHPIKRVQIRIQAKAILHQLDELSKIFWAQVQGDAQKAYGSILAPGTEIEQPEEAFAWNQKIDFSFFTPIQFIPQTVEVLQLDGSTHLRIVFSKVQETWAGQWLVP